MATVLDGVPEDGAVPHHHAAPFAMSSMRLRAAASGFRRISSQMALETWPVWVVWHLLVHDGDVPQRGRGLHPAVVLQPLLHPAVVEALRGFVQHQLQDGLAGPDLEDRSPGAPVPLAVLAHVALPGLPFCLRDEFPRGDGAQDQATLHVRPEDMLRLRRIVLLPAVLAHHAVDVVRCDGGVNDPLITLSSLGRMSGPSAPVRHPGAEGSRPISLIMSLV